MVHGQKNIKIDVLRYYGYCSFSSLCIYFNLLLSRVISLHVLKLIAPSSVCPFCLKQYSVFCLLSPSPPSLNSFVLLVNLLLKLFRFPLSCASLKRSLFLLSCPVLPCPGWSRLLLLLLLLLLSAPLRAHFV